jgi:hypothetical protein
MSEGGCFKGNKLSLFGSASEPCPKDERLMQCDIEEPVSTQAIPVFLVGVFSNLHWGCTGHAGCGLLRVRARVNAQDCDALSMVLVCCGCAVAGSRVFAPACAASVALLLVSQVGIGGLMLCIRVGPRRACPWWVVG